MCTLSEQSCVASMINSTITGGANNSMHIGMETFVGGLEDATKLTPVRVTLAT